MFEFCPAFDKKFAPDESQLPSMCYIALNVLLINNSSPYYVSNTI